MSNCNGWIATSCLVLLLFFLSFQLTFYKSWCADEVSMEMVLFIQEAILAQLRRMDSLCSFPMAKGNVRSILLLYLFLRLILKWYFVRLSLKKVRKVYKWEFQPLLCLYLFTVKPILIEIIQSIWIRKPSWQLNHDYFAYYVIFSENCLPRT